MWTAADLAILFGSLAVPAAGTWAGMKWWLTRADEKEKAELAREDKKREDEFARQDDLREELRSDLQKRIDELILTVKLQGSTINGLYSHIRKLEQRMAQAGLEIPQLDIEEILRKMP